MRRYFKLVRRVICVALIAIALLTFATFALDDISTGSMYSNEPHIYTVLPGTDEWNAMTMAQRMASCSVTQDEVQWMTTPALVETVVNYPYLINMYAFDTILDGIEAVSEYFPGLEELFSRADAVSALQAYKTGLETSDSDDVTLERLHVDTLISALNDIGTSAYQTVPVRATLYTPNNREVDAYCLTSYADLEMIGGYPQGRYEELEYAYSQAYPTAIKISNMTYKYNCHSYAWHSASTSNIYWVPSCSEYILDPYYVATSTPVADAKIVYSTNHSGIVTAFTLNHIWVTSKWGGNGLYVHYADDCPYASGSGTMTYYVVR